MSATLDLAQHDLSSSFEPVAIEARYPAPRRSVDPDTTKGWLQRLRPVALAHPLLGAASLTAALFAMLANVAIPIVVQRTIDNALGPARSESLEPYVVALCVLALLRGALAFAFRYGLYRLAYLIETDLRSILYRHLTRLSFGYYDRMQSGQVISRANSDIRSVQMFLAFAPLMSMTVITFALAFTYMVSVSWSLTVVAIAALPGVYAVGARLRNQVFPLSWITQSRLADLASLVSENVDGVRVIRSFADEERQITLLARTAQRLQWVAVKTADVRAQHAPLMEGLPRLCMVGVLVYGGSLVIDGQIEVGVLIAFNAYILMLQAPFRLLGFFLMLQQRAKASAERIFEVLDEVPEIVDAPNASNLDLKGGRVEFDRVRFAYRDGTPILSEFTLEIEPGERVALVGRTGSGKSTVARLLTRFYDVSEGAIRIDGQDVRSVTTTSLRHHVGLVLDEPFLFSISVRDNIAYGRPDASDEEVKRVARAAQADRFISELSDGYDTIVGERGYTLSGGQRQRIAIARTLLLDPPILVLDDATSAIDVQVERGIHEALEGLLANRTTLVIAHRLSTIALADRVVLLEGGAVAATGTHQELLAGEPRYVDILSHLAADTNVGSDG